MSFEVLRMVRDHNQQAREDDEREQARLAQLPPNAPSSPLPGACGGAMDTTTGRRP